MVLVKNITDLVALPWPREVGLHPDYIRELSFFTWNVVIASVGGGEITNVKACHFSHFLLNRTEIFRFAIRGHF